MGVLKNSISFSSIIMVLFLIVFFALSDSGFAQDASGREAKESESSQEADEPNRVSAENAQAEENAGDSGDDGRGREDYNGSDKKNSENDKAKEKEEQNECFNIFISEGIPLLHPHLSFNADEAQLLSAVYEGLFIYDPKTLSPIGGIAESWKVTGGRTWRFILRKDAKFENGDAITAETFKASWLNLLSPSLNCPYASLLDCIDGAADWRRGKLKNKNQIGIQVESEYILTVYTTAPCQHLPLILCHHAFSAVHPSQLGVVASLMKKKEFKNVKEAFRPISSGPFRVTDWTAEKIVFEKNKAYWDANDVKLSHIVSYTKLKDEDASYMFNVGKLHWLNNATLIKDVVDKQTIHIGAMFATEYFYFRLDSEATKNEKIREALLLAIPYERLRSQYLIPATTLVFPLPDYPRLQGIDEYNIYKAKNILENVKLNEKNEKIKIIFPENTYYDSLAKILKEAWERLGFVVEWKSYAPSEYYVALKKPGYSVAPLSWIADFADPTSFLEMFRQDSSLNNTLWKNAEYENLLKIAASEQDARNRYKKLSEAEELLLDSNVIIPLSHNPSVNVIDLYQISGWYPNAINIHPFKFIKIKKGKAVQNIAVF